jgi:hypothetical protein
VKSPFLDDNLFLLTSDVLLLDDSVLNFIGGSAIPFTQGNPHVGPVHYSPIKALEFPTGVRAEKTTADQVVITGSNSDNVATIYEGTLQALPNTPDSRWHVLQPQFAGQTVTESLFYGPNTSLFDPSLGAGNIRAVGTYQTDSDSTRNHGMMYQGPLDDSGTWTQIDATPLVPPDQSLKNTIPHSTMGDLVVGNYDIDVNASPGHAFIYDIADRSWMELRPTDDQGVPITALSITAYGIWQNGDSNSTSYTIAGGFSDVHNAGIDEGYVVDFDSATKTYSQFTAFNFNNMPALVSHFDGITATANGYNLTGEFLAPDGGIGGFFASIAREADGLFSKADWTPITVPGASLTTGNTVIDNHVLGIYGPGETAPINSYIATVWPQSS